MKRKLPLLLAALMLLSAMYVPVAYAAPSAGRNDEEIDIADDDVPLVELPTVDIVPEVTVDQSGTAIVEVKADQIMDAVKSVIDGDAVRIAITATAAPSAGNDSATVKAVSAVVPKEALKAVVDQTDAEIEIITNVGHITLPDSAIASIVERAGGDNVSFNMNQKPVDVGRDVLQEALGTAMNIAEEVIQGASITEINILSGDTSIVSWEGGEASLDLPIGSGQYELGKGYRVVQINADGTVTEHIGRCVLDANGNMYVEISVSQLGTFVVLPEAVEEDMGAAPTPMVASPLAAAGNAGSGSGGSGMTCILAGLVLVSGAVCVVMLKRRIR